LDGPHDAAQADGTRLDRALVERGLARSRSHAQAMIAAGQVSVNDVVADRASTSVGARDRLVASPDPYVSRGAHKLLGALDDLGLEVAGRALDAGASTGGFTQVLLERGCGRVYAVDVGTDQLAPALRADPRVAVRERTNLRELTLDQLEGDPVDLVVADLSFIPLSLVLERLVAVARPDADVVLLVKPQFEVGRSRLGKNGVVREPSLRREAVRAVSEHAENLGWPVRRCVRSRHPGPTGNVEFFVWLQRGPTGPDDPLGGVDFG
jgi:23S rRNA (cytidine1920-2'-O)/16S rRNA (cytidine1409-2'-O)-methyltransferase